MCKTDCTCFQCEDCKVFYADIVAHKCNKTPSFCMECFMDITSSTNKCYFCEFDKIMSVCEAITPFKLNNITQCLRCLFDIVDNILCPCKPSNHCDLYFTVGEPYKSCRKKKQFCDDCNNDIISHSKKCLLCESKKQKSICDKCPFLIKDGNTIYCECTNIVGEYVFHIQKNSFKICI